MGLNVNVDQLRQNLSVKWVTENGGLLARRVISGS
jgi:hypothetical protein